MIDIPGTGEATAIASAPLVNPSSAAVNPSTTRRKASGMRAPPGLPRRASISSWPSVLRSTTNVSAFATIASLADQISSLPPLRRSVQAGKTAPAWPCRPM